MRRSPRLELVLPAVACLIPLIGVKLASGGHDDAYITFGAARCLAATGHIYNYNGEPVEQSSTLLFTVLLAVAHLATRISIVTLGYCLSIAFGVTTVWLSGSLARRIDPSLRIPVMLLAATNPWLLFWSYSGMEMSCAATCILLVALTVDDFIHHGRRLLLAVASTLLAVMVRPELPFALLAVLGALLLLRLVSQRRIVSREAALVAIVSSELLALALFRHRSFGRFFPEPVYAKSRGLHWDVLADGVEYLVYHCGRLACVPMLLALAGFAIRTVRRTFTRPTPSIELECVLWIGAYFSMVLLTGGDWMRGARFLVPVVPLWAIGAATLPSVAERWRGLGFMVLLVANVVGAITLSRNVRALPLWARQQAARKKLPFSWFELQHAGHVHDILFLSPLESFLDRAAQKGKRLVVMSEQAGLDAYYLSADRSDMRFVDEFGLTDRTFATCALTKDIPRSALGRVLDLDMYLHNRRAFERECKIPSPDLIFGNFSSLEDEQQLTRSFHESGYELGYVDELCRPGEGPSREGWGDTPCGYPHGYIAVPSTQPLDEAERLHDLLSP